MGWIKQTSPLGVHDLTCNLFPCPDYHSEAVEGNAYLLRCRISTQLNEMQIESKCVRVPECLCLTILLWFDMGIL